LQNDVFLSDETCRVNQGTHWKNWYSAIRWKTVLVGQIHDSIVADVSHDELDIFLDFVKHVMTKRIHKHWEFLSAPMEIEAEVADLGATWFDKKPYAIGLR